MAITLVSAGSFNNVFNAANTPTAGSAFLAGDKILVHTGEVMGTDATPATPSGFTNDTPNNHAKQIAVYRLDSITGSEAMPSITWGNQWTWAYVEIWRGLAAGAPTNSDDRAGNVAANGTTCFTGPAASVTPSQANSLVKFFGQKNKSTSVNSGTISTPSGWTLASSQVVSGSGTRIMVASFYQVQTTVTTIAANTSCTQNPADTVQQSNQGVIMVYAPLVAAPNPVPPLNLGSMNVQVCL